MPNWNAALGVIIYMKVWYVEINNGLVCKKLIHKTAEIAWHFTA